MGRISGGAALYRHGWGIKLFELGLELRGL